MSAALRIVMAQLNLLVGDVPGNVRKIGSCKGTLACPFYITIFCNCNDNIFTRDQNFEIDFNFFNLCYYYCPTVICKAFPYVFQLFFDD